MYQKALKLVSTHYRTLISKPTGMTDEAELRVWLKMKDVELSDFDFQRLCKQYRMGLWQWRSYTLSPYFSDMLTMLGISKKYGAAGYGVLLDLAIRNAKEKHNPYTTSWGVTTLFQDTNPRTRFSWHLHAIVTYGENPVDMLFIETVSLPYTNPTLVYAGTV